MGCYTQTNPSEAIELVDILIGTDQRKQVYNYKNKLLINVIIFKIISINNF